MADKFLEIAVTDAVAKAQRHYYGKAKRLPHDAPNDALTDDEIQFIQARDSFYLGTVSESGWPYIQHRGGLPGFLHVLSPSKLAFADFYGNRQLLSTGNLATSNKVSLFLMDYPNRTRLKILGHGHVEDARQHLDLAKQLTAEKLRPQVERIFFIGVVSYDWNCPKHITPRYSVEEIEKIVELLKQRIAELERK